MACWSVWRGAAKGALSANSCVLSAVVAVRLEQQHRLVAMPGTFAWRNSWLASADTSNNALRSKAAKHSLQALQTILSGFADLLSCWVLYHAGQRDKCSVPLVGTGHRHSASYLEPVSSDDLQHSTEVAASESVGPSETSCLQVAEAQ